MQTFAPPRITVASTFYDSAKSLFAHHTGKDELCGVIIGTHVHTADDVPMFSLTDCIQVPNTAADINAHFEISKRDAKQAAGDLFSDIIGSIHTHPGHNPSDPSWVDVDFAPYNTINVVFHVRRSTLAFYTFEHGWVRTEQVV